MPIIVTLHPLDRDALVRILKEPRNALVKQYQKLFEMDDAILEFTDESLEAIADKAIARDTGARGLRAIIEEMMLDVMYEIPSSSVIEKCVITKDTVINSKPPELIINENRKPLRKSYSKKSKIKRESVS